MKLFELHNALKKNGPGPLYLVLGEEDELRDQAVATIKAALSQDDGYGDFNCEVLYGDESDASEIIAHAGEAPVFAPRRLIIVKTTEKLSARDGEALIPYLKSPCDSTTLVFVAIKVDGRTKFAQALKEQTVTIDCGPLPESQCVPWIRAEAVRIGVRLDDAAMLLMRDLAGSNSLSFIKRELEKLAAYVPAERVATPADVEALQGGEVGASVFDLTTAIGAGDRLRVLRIFTRNLENGEAPLRILGSLVWQYRQVWKAKDSLQGGKGESEAARMLRVPPFKVREFVGRFSDAHMQKAFRLFAETDGKLKGASATAPARVLESVGLELCRLTDLPRPKGAAHVTGLRQAGRAGMTPEQPSTTRTIRSGPPTGR
ncbi:MAG TPA: DNA polymerase III subunit delta [Nitrospiraceae bacterium]|nr:DNA polymerase III subunit delta [Nitrospiraceae bacterium]